MRRNVCFIIYHTWLFRKRHVFLTLIQIVAPVIILILFTTHSQLLYSKFSREEGGSAYSEADLYKSLFNPKCTEGVRLSYYASKKHEDFAHETIADLKNILVPPPGETPLTFFHVLHQEDIIKAAILHHAYARPECYLGGITFSNAPFEIRATGVSKINSTQTTQMPDSQSRKYRKYSPLSMNLWVELWMPDYISFFEDTRHPVQLYYDPAHPEEFLPRLGLELAIARAYENRIATHGVVSETSVPAQLKIKRFFVAAFPVSPSYEYYDVLDSGQPLYVIVSIGIVLGQTFMVMSVVRGPVLDKQNGFVLYLKHVGLPHSVYWCSWWINEFIIRCIVSALEVIVLFLSNIGGQISLIQRGNIFLWFIFLIVYNMATISTLLFFCTFYNHGATATYIGATTLLLSFYFGDLFLSTEDSYLQSIVSKILLCLNPNCALIVAAKVMTTSVGGIQWGNIFTRSGHNELTFVEVVALLVFDSILFLGMAVFLDNQRTDQSNFTVIRLFKSFIRVRSVQCWNSFYQWSRGLIMEDEADSVTSNYEDEDDITFSNVTVQVSKQCKMVDDVNLQVYAHKRTAIVGSHGSGKTTLARLICGVYPPTRGDVHVCGHHSVTENSKIREKLSYCPERNTLCHYINLFEHLKLVGVLRGYSLGKVRRKSKDILAALDLTKFQDRFPEDLVNIQKRKLCIAMALIGKSKVILFDSPTIGMAYETATNIFNFIMNYCKGKTLVLLTSRFSEAYFFGERLAILAQGRILGSGTREQLEYCLQVGYHLELVLEPNVESKTAVSFVKSHIPQSEKVDKQSTRVKRVLEVMDRDAVEYSKRLSTFSRRKSLSESRVSRITTTSNEIFFDAKSGSIPVEPDLSKLDLSAGNQEELNSVTILLLKSEASKFATFFMVLENPKFLIHNGIRSYTVAPYTLERAYEEVEQYIRLDEGKSNYSVKNAEQIQAISLRVLRDSQIPPLQYPTMLYRFHAELCKIISFIVSTWISRLPQYLVPLTLLLITIGAAEEFLQTKLQGRIVVNDLRLYYKPVVFIKAQQPFPPLYYHYKNVIAPAKYEEITKTNSTNATVVNMEKFSHIVGIDIDGDKSTALFSSVASHSAQTSLTLMLNAYLKARLPEASIQVVSRAIQHEREELLRYYLDIPTDFDKNPASSFTVIIAFGFFIFTSRMIIHPLSEKILQLKHLQLSTGLSRLTYWLSFFICDMTMTLILGVLLAIMLYFLPPYLPQHDPDFLWYFMIFILVASASCIVQSHALSFVFNQPKTCYFAMVSYNQFTGLFLFIGTTLLPLELAVIMRCILHIFQPFAVVSGFYHLFTTGFHNSRCHLMHASVRSAICTEMPAWNITMPNGTNIDRSCCDLRNRSNKKAYIDFKLLFQNVILEHLLIDMIVLIIHTVIWSVLIMSTELRWCNRYMKRYIPKRFIIHEEEEDDNEDNESEVLPGLEVNDKFKRLEVQQICKKFFGGSLLLRDISFTVASGDLLAIVGPEKSGKTLLAGILAGYRRPTRGRAFCTHPEKNDDLMNFNYITSVGYVPSHDVLRDLHELKGITMLKLFARLRKVPPKQVKFQVKKWALLLGLGNHYNYQYKYYTISMRRRIALAMAFIGEPPIIILDEPLIGLDPFSRRQFWTIVNYLRRKLLRIVILLTSETTDLEENASKIGILVNGEMTSLDTTSNWASTFSGIFNINLKFCVGVTFLDCNAVKLRFARDFPINTIREEFHRELDYTVQSSEEESMDFSNIFAKLEALMNEFPEVLADYHVSSECMRYFYRSLAKDQRPYRKPTLVRDEFCLRFC